MTTNFTFNGPATGSFSGAGDARTGDISLMYQQQAPQIASEQLRLLLNIIKSDPQVPSEIATQVATAKDAPTKTAIEKILEWLRVAKEGGVMAAATVGAAPGIIEQLGKVVPYLPF